MAQILSEISIKDDKLFKNKFSWTSIPKFSVIAGLNGSGKSKLLERIVKKLNGERKSQKFFYFSYNHNLDNLFSQSLNESQLRQEEDRLLGTLKSWKNNWVNSLTQKNELKNNGGEFIDIAIALEKEHDKELQNFSDTEIKEAVSNISMEFYQENVNNNKISQFFLRYKNKKNNLWTEIGPQDIAADERRQIVEERLIKIFGTNKSPWDLINEKFSNYNFKHQINKPTDEGSYLPQFVTKDGNEIKFSELSSGEKMIVQLILWSYNEANVGNRGKLLIMDEFDAHLNPSMAEIFIKIIKEILVRNFDMQVIMTTHSPSTVVYCEESDLFWMEDFQIHNIAKKEIVSRLSSGLMLLDDAKDAISVLFKVRNNGKFLFVEGPSDKIYLEKAIRVLGFDSLTETQIVPCTSTTKIKTIIDFFRQNLGGDFKEENNLILVDNDGAGREVKENGAILVIRTELEIKDSIKNHLDSVKFHHPIEFLFPLQLLLDNGIILERKEICSITNLTEDEVQKIKPQIKEEQPILLYQLKTDDKVFKKNFAQSLEESKENFENFIPLLQKIENVLNCQIK